MLKWQSPTIVASLVAMGLFVAGCETKPIDTKGVDAELEESMFLVGLTRDSSARSGIRPLAERPREIETVIKSETDLKDALDALRVGAKGERKNLRERLREILDENDGASDGLPSFRGLGGRYTLVLLAAAAGKLGAKDTFDPAQIVRSTVWGKITRYTYDPGQRSGRLRVRTRVELRVNNSLLAVETYVYKIKILEGGYEVIPHSGDRDDPFPDSLAFGEKMLKRVERKGFNVKLHVRKGDKIEIVDVIRNGVPVSSGSNLRKSHPEDCIDLMVKVPEDAQGRPDLSQIPTDTSQLRDLSYCLGRCEKPAIINTK